MKFLALLLVTSLPFLSCAQPIAPQGTRAQGSTLMVSEHLVLNWPQNEHWKIGADHENSQQRIVDMIHENETLKTWTEIGNMTFVKGVANVPMDEAMKLTHRQIAFHAPDAKLTLIKKGKTQECTWVIFTIEAPGFREDNIPESQLWFILQGKEGLYTNFVSVKKAVLPENFKTKWTAFFEKAKLVYDKK